MKAGRYASHWAGFWQNATGPLFGCILPQMVWIVLCKTSLDPVLLWLTVSGLEQTDPVWKQAGVQESLSPLLVSASNLIWTGCESDPACILGTLHSMQFRLLKLLDLHAHDLLFSGHDSLQCSVLLVTTVYGLLSQRKWI